MELRFWAGTDTGRVRDHNEDNFLVDKKLQLFVVCDGMGGHAAGEVASAVCVRTVREVVAGEEELLTEVRERPEDKEGAEKLTQLMGHAVRAANARIYEMAQQDASRRGMGTTCIALILVGERGYVGHVGDSRIYCLREGKVDQVTDDHSLLNEMIRQGKVPPGTTEEEFPHNNAVTRAVGVREAVDVDSFSFELELGDRLLMCSDGLSEYLTKSVDFKEMMGSGEPKETIQNCIDHANQSGGKDNITVAVIDCMQAGAKAEKEDTKEKTVHSVERQEAIEILRETAYFHYLAPPELEQVRKMATRLVVEADKAVVADDEDNDRMFLILKGSVSLQLDGQKVAVLTSGEHFGEMALIDAQDENDTNMVARALEPSILLAIRRDQFVSLIRTAPGLAVKLLWNFAQVFADRLQSVPPEFRFTPDEWRRDPDAIADVTPSSGALVFEEDLERMKKGKSAKAAASAEELDEATRSTMSLDAIDRKQLEQQIATVEGGLEVRTSVDEGDLGDTPPLTTTLPPGSLNSSSGSGSGADSDFDGGLSSGTYDQSILETGLDDDSEDDDQGPPSVSFNLSDDGQKPSADEEEGKKRSESDQDDLRKTVKIDWGSQEETQELEGLRSLRRKAPKALKEKLRKKLGSRPAPEAGVLAHAKSRSVGSEKNQASGEDEKSSSPSKPPMVPADARVKEKNSESDDKKKRSSVKNEPKVMISPDLMGDVDDED